MVHVRRVDNQEAVVASLVLVYRYRWILAVVLLQIQPQFTAHRLRVYVGFHAVVTLAEHQQDGFIDIVVYQHHGLFCRPQQIGNELVNIEYLPVVEDTLHKGQRSTDKEVDLFGVFRNGMFQLGQAAIDGIAFQQIFLQDPVRPLAELRTAMAFYPIANRDRDYNT